MINPWIWIRNVIRVRSKKSLLGKIIRELHADYSKKIVHLVSATRHDESVFWHSSALGKSLINYRDIKNLKINIHYSNTLGLPAIYNEYIKSVSSSDILLFIHDDIWLDDPDWLHKTLKALEQYDIVGIAGNVRFGPFQPGWIFKAIVNGQFVWDTGYLSGTVAHGKYGNGKKNNYGPTPMECKVIDGLFIAARCSYLRRGRVMFDERFKFHFYDLDFCRSANKAGLTIGTWPIALTHQSGGAYGTPLWQESYSSYLAKWSNG